MRFRADSRIALAALISAVLLGGALCPGAGWTAADPPQAVDLETTSFEIIAAEFVEDLVGANAVFSETMPDLYRGLLLTLKVHKPAGRELALYAQDVNLHYTFGEKEEIARCCGVSTFSTEPDTERLMGLFDAGIGGSITGTATTEAGMVFVDLFFRYMEADTTDLHLFIAQPARASFECDGWQ